MTNTTVLQGWPTRTVNETIQKRWPTKHYYRGGGQHNITTEAMTNKTIGSLRGVLQAIAGKAFKSNMKWTANKWNMKQLIKKTLNRLHWLITSDRYLIKQWWTSDQQNNTKNIQYTQTQTDTHTHTDLCKHAFIETQTHMHTHTKAHTLANTPTHTHTNAHAHTHTQNDKHKK